MTSISDNLNDAKKRKVNEFYTRYEDIAKEVSYYRDHFDGKTVYCNCDSYTDSNFHHYFYDNFRNLGLKGLTTTHYTENSRDSVGRRYDKLRNSEDFGLNGDGDFRSSTCVDELKKADIIVTNPPFSLFRDFIDLLFKYNKKFLIIGNINAITYKKTFRLLKDYEMWTGNCMPRFFKVHSGEVRNTGAVYWYTNLTHEGLNRKLELTCKYNGKDYPKYDNFYAISVMKVKEIPYDYYGLMGVPISFMRVYNPKQFKVLGLDYHVMEGKDRSLITNGRTLYKRVIIRRK